MPSNTDLQTGLDSHYEELIAELKLGNTAGLQEVYEAYRDDFLSWAQARFRCPEQDALDVYQELMLAFYENARKGSIDQLRGKLRTYLFGIGKYMLIQRYKTMRQVDTLDEVPPDLTAEQAAIDHQLAWDDRREIMWQAIQALGDSCRDLLIMVYYHRIGQDIIAERLGYKNTDVVKSQKVRCMQKLRKHFRTHFQPDQL